MKSIIRKTLLAVSLGLFLIQFGTAQTCFAEEVSKTDQKPDPVVQRPPEGQLPNVLLSLATNTSSFSKYALLVDKARRTLSVWENAGDKIKLVDAFPTDIGANEGDKMFAGDSKTPEGIYFFQTTQEGKKINFEKYGVRIFTMDYPNYFDRLDKKTGNGIWLHAVPDSTSLSRGSHGCVVVRNTVVECLRQYIELKRTPIVVVNEVEYMPEKDWLERQAQFKKWLEDWRSSWSGKDLDKYMAQYSERFQGNHMNKTQWRAYKKNLNERYETIDVNLQDIQIFTQGPKLVMRFIQNYNSGQKIDRGTKIIYALKGPEKYEIIGENWEPIH